MLADRLRHDAFRAALARVLNPGHSTVADIGAGTGVLAFFARELGAREVWLYEPGPALALAEVVAARNGIEHLNFVPARSLDVPYPPAVDVVVAEVLGNFAYEEGVLETLRDAQRFLSPGGTLIPHSIVQWAAPVTADRFERDFQSWRGVGHGLDWSDAEHVTRNNMYVFEIQPKDLLQTRRPHRGTRSSSAARSTAGAPGVSRGRSHPTRRSSRSHSGGSARSCRASCSRRARSASARTGTRSICRCSSR